LIFQKQNIIYLEEKLLVKPEMTLKRDNQQLVHKTLRKFYVKLKDYLAEEASWKREVDFRRDYFDFDIEDYDF